MGDEHTGWFMGWRRRYGWYTPTRTQPNVLLCSFRDSQRSCCCDDDGCFELLVDSLSLKLRWRYPSPSVALPPPPLPLLPSHSLSPSLSALPPIFPSPSVSPSLLSLCPSLSLLRVSLYLCVSPCVSPCVRVSLRVSLCVFLCVSLSCLSRCVSLCASLSVSVSLRLCVSLSLFCVSLSYVFVDLSPCLHVAQEVGSYVSVCRRPCLEHQSMGQALNPLTSEDHTSCVSPCSHAPSDLEQPHVCHRQKTGLSPLARTRSWTWSFLKRSHIWTHRFLCLTSFTSEHHDPQNCRNFPVRHHVWVLQRVFSAPAGASCI